jgi:hypothetical protein
MARTSVLAPKPRVRDPRGAAGFHQGWYPSANGGEAPAAGARDRNERIQIEFLAVYYELNVGYAALLEVRAARSGEGRCGAERRQLRGIERGLRRRDALEDHYAPLGVVAEPVMREGFAVDVRFTFGNVDASGRLRTEGYVTSAYVALPVRRHGDDVGGD